MDSKRKDKKIKVNEYKTILWLVIIRQYILAPILPQHSNLIANN